MKYQGCEGCCGHGVYSSGGTCEWCRGRGDRNGSFSFSVEVEGKTFTSTLWDVDGEYRYSPSTTGFPRDLLVEVVGECWRWALAPEYSGWTPLEGGIREPAEEPRAEEIVREVVPPKERQIKILSYLPRKGESPAEAEKRILKLFSDQKEVNQ